MLLVLICRKVYPKYPRVSPRVISISSNRGRPAKKKLLSEGLRKEVERSSRLVECFDLQVIQLRRG